MIASPVQLLVPILLHVIMDLKELHRKVGSPPSVADRPRGSGTAQTTSGGARSQSSPSRTQMFVAMEAETRIDVSSSLGNIHDQEDPPGQTPQRRACRHWAVQWPALQNGCLNPVRCAVLECQQASSVAPWLITTLGVLLAAGFWRASTKASKRPRDQSIVSRSRNAASKTGLLLLLLAMSAGAPCIC